MTIHTIVPLELVLEGWSIDPAPMMEVTIGEMRLLVSPVAAGVGRVERLLSAPLHLYLQPEYAPGQLVYFGASANPDFKV